ncbi:MAG: ABC transporter permease [Arachnia sp.]
MTRFAHYYAFSLGTIVRDWAFLLFIIAMPVTMYLFFSAIYVTGTTEEDAFVSAIMMITMATYGGLGAAMNAGSSIQSERSSGWFRTLMLTPLQPAEFVGAKVLTAVTVVMPALLVVFAAGILRGVRLDLDVWAATFVLLLVALLPMVLLGLAIGLLFKPQTASAVTTLVMLALSMVGGLWVPLEAMPAAMQTLGRLTPSYWAGQIGSWPLVGGDFPWQGVRVIVVWSVLLLAAGAISYRRAVRTSRRSN